MGQRTKTTCFAKDPCSLEFTWLLAVNKLYSTTILGKPTIYDIPITWSLSLSSFTATQFNMLCAVELFLHPKPQLSFGPRLETCVPHQTPQTYPKPTTMDSQPCQKIRLGVFLEMSMAPCKNLIPEPHSMASKG